MGPPLPTSPIGRVMGSPSAPCVLGVFQDYTCPFSARLWKRLVADVVPKYVDAGKLRIAFHHQVQPWHPTSSMCHEAALAVARVGGDEAFWKFSLALMEQQVDFFDLSTYDMPRSAVYDKLSELAHASAGVEAKAVRELLMLDPAAIASGQKNPGTQMCTELKLQIKYGRQLGVHVSPTTTWNGMICDTSSGWSAEEWSAFLDPLIEQASA